MGGPSISSHGHGRDDQAVRVQGRIAPLAEANLKADPPRGELHRRRTGARTASDPAAGGARHARAAGPAGPPPATPSLAGARSATKVIAPPPP
jgi:hypothetical protein